MIDTTAVALALRNQALTLSVCTTGSTTLSATATGYARAAGSFITDGFKPGMECKAAGFVTANVGYSVITQVTSTDLTIDGGRTVEAAGSGKSLTVGMPQTRAFENIQPALPDSRSYVWVREEFVPATTNLHCFPAQSSVMEETGLYILTWFGLPKYGVGGIRASVDALRALFTPGTTLLAGSTPVKITGTSLTQPGPNAGQLIPTGDGWVYCQLRIPWSCYTTNTVAA